MACREVYTPPNPGCPLRGWLEDGASSRTPTSLALCRAASSPGPLGPRLPRQAVASLGRGAAGAEGVVRREALRGPPAAPGSSAISQAGRSAFTRPRELRAEARAAPAAGRELTFSEAGAGVYNYCPPPRQQRRPGVRGCGGGGGEAGTPLPTPPPPPQSRRGGGGGGDLTS